MKAFFEKSLQFTKKREIASIFLLAIILRILLMPFLYHPDIKTFNFQASFLQTGVFDIYKYLDENKKKLPLKEEFVYQPLAYFTLGSYQTIIKPLMGRGFDSWLWDASQQSVETIGFYRYLFWLKFPYLLLDVLVGYLLVNLFNKFNDKKHVFSLWLLNPFSIFIIYAYGNIDIYPVFLVTAGFIFAKKGKLPLSALLLGIASAFKAYPILFLPLIILKSKNIKELFFTLFIGIFSFLVFVFPFLSESFLKASLVSGLTTRVLLPTIYIGLGFKLPIPLTLIAILYLLSFVKKFKLEYSFMILMIILLSFILYHVQWILWAMPFVVLTFIKNPKSRISLILFLSLAFLIPLFYNDRSMTVSLYSGYSYYFTLLPTPFSVIQRFFNTTSFISLLKIVLMVAGGISIWKILNYQKS